MNRCSALFALVLLIGMAETAAGNNNWFLPGDAFFYAQPDQAWFSQLATTGEPILVYSRPVAGPGGRFCGYAGYRQIKLKNLSPQMRANLLNAYRELRSTWPLIVDSSTRTRQVMRDGRMIELDEQQLHRTELNPIRLFIYNGDFDLQRFRPCLRYNEDWANAAASFGHSRDHVVFDFFVDEPRSIEEDWRDAPLVDPLRFTVPQPELQGTEKLGMTIEIDCTDVQFLMFPSVPFSDLAQPPNQINLKADQPETAMKPFGRNQAPAETESVDLAGFRITADDLHKLSPASRRWTIGESIMPLALRPESRNDEPWWTERLAAKTESVTKKPDVDVLLIGDSITHSWDDHTAIWNECFPETSMLNHGFSGDRTEHVLWRLQNGSINGTTPSVVMLMIGTNNTGHRMDPPIDIARGIDAIVADLKKRLPESRILLLGVFPRGAAPEDADRLNNQAVNEMIRGLEDNEQVFFVDVGSTFFAEDGSLTRGVRDDFLHLNADGYRVWAEAVRPALNQLLER